MSKIGILEADPTRFGGVQEFVRTLGGYLPPEKVELLAYYGDLANEKQVPCCLVELNNRKQRSFVSRLFFSSRKNVYYSHSSLKRNFALLLDLFHIRKTLEGRYPGGDTLIANSASALLFFCSRKVLKNNRIVLVQHTDPRIMYSRSFDFGGFFRKKKIEIFRKYVDTFVLLSEDAKKEFALYLPLKDKKIVVIRHAVKFPVSISQTYPNAVAMLCRLVKLKRIDRLIACAKLLPKLNFNIYGTGPEAKKLKESARQMPNVFFHGYTNDIDLVFKNNTLLAITSEYEGYPISGIEACVRGRPLVVLDTFSAASDLVVNDFNGILVEHFSPELFSSAISMIMENPQKFQAGALQHRELYNCNVAKKKWQDLLLGGEDDA